MIRQPLNSATGRSRAEISRVADGIAASLRAFSTAQRLAATPPSQDGVDSSSPRPSARQRAAAAYSDLDNLNNGNRPQPAGQSSFTVRRTTDPRSESATSTAPGGRALNRIDLRSESATISVPSGPSSGTPNVIRGGLRGGFRGRGRGGFSRGGAMAGAGRPRGGSGGGSGGMMGQGRPRGGGGQSGGPRFKRPGGKREQDKEDEEAGPADDDWSPEVKAMWETKEIGTLHQFDPSFSKSDLVGFGPGVPIDGSSAAKDDTVLQQARILGGAQGFRAGYTLRKTDLWGRYKRGTGVFFPDEEAKKWSLETMEGLEYFRVQQRTKDAVLQATLLGSYNGPQHVDVNDTLGTVRSYVTRGATWNADASRRIEEKVRSLLPGGRTGPAGATGKPRATA